MYYQARERLRAGDNENALNIYLEAYDYCSSIPIEQAIKKLGYELEEKESAWLNKPFPLLYNLPDINNRREKIDLDDCLLSMKEGQVHLICLLASYRSNGPYDDFMQRYSVYAKYFSDVIVNLHVITSTRKSGNWQDQEDKAKAEKINFSVLYDKNGTLAEATEIRSIPAVFALDRHGKVIFRKRLLLQTEVWELLEKLCI